MFLDKVLFKKTVWTSRHCFGSTLCPNPSETRRYMETRYDVLIVEEMNQLFSFHIHLHHIKHVIFYGGEGGILWKKNAPRGIF